MSRPPDMQRVRDRVRHEVIAALRTACARAVRDPARIEAVMLFGSLARGDFDGLSDADIAVIGDRQAFDSGVFSAFDRPVDVVAVAPARWRSADLAAGDMVADIRAEAIPLWP
ncbi:nucleotidyltransferase family protein [uncultured Rhodospira sp.]|uniref:nucleotidyltransferase family protein n=1 Tax=uncultured Rhodospira sp. TaxID=1936189 RepID=UPI002622AB3A|nr:nucleotidyltransferase domain-containing protein [uncultured Rhodospira sp.]